TVSYVLQSDPLSFPTRRSSDLKGIYIWLCVIYFAVIIGYYLFDPFGFEHPGRDTWHHLAVLKELMASPFHPSNPHIPTGEPSRRSEEHTSELQSRENLVCRLLL